MMYVERVKTKTFLHPPLLYVNYAKWSVRVVSINRLLRHEKGIEKPSTAFIAMALKKQDHFRTVHSNRSSLKIYIQRIWVGV